MENNMNIKKLTIFALMFFAINNNIIGEFKLFEWSTERKFSAKAALKTLAIGLSVYGINKGIRCFEEKSSIVENPNYKEKAQNCQEEEQDENSIQKYIKSGKTQFQIKLKEYHNGLFKFCTDNKVKHAATLAAGIIATNSLTNYFYNQMARKNGSVKEVKLLTGCAFTKILTQQRQITNKFSK